jgi:hypothetical protein
LRCQWLGSSEAFHTCKRHRRRSLAAALPARFRGGLPLGAALQKEDGRNRKGSKAAHANSTIARHGRGRKRRPGGGRRGARAHRHRVVVRTVTGVLSESETSIVCMRRCAWRRRWRRRWEAEGLSAFDFGASCGCEFGRSTETNRLPGESFFFLAFRKKQN